MGNIHKLIKQHALIIDVSTLDSLANANRQELDSMFLHIDKDPDFILTFAIGELSKSVSLQRYLILLEHLVLFDLILFDKHAATVAGATISRDLSSFIKAVDVPTVVYQKASKAVDEVKKKLIDKLTQPQIESLIKPSPLGGGDPFWSGGEKRLHDRFEEENIRGIPRSLANTNDSLGRALFYLEVSRALRTPCSLSGGKSLWLSTIRETILPTVHEKIAQLIDNEIKKAVGELIAAGPDLPCGPVAEMVLRDSIFKKEPLSATAIRIREEDTDAKDYRQLLAELRMEIDKGRFGWKRVGEIMKQLKRVAEIWSSSQDFRLEVSRKKRTLKLDKLPLIGDLLSFASMDEVEIRDVLLNKPPGYLAFIAKWYQ